MVIKILRLKKSHVHKNEWILYNPDNFNLHTHCGNKRVALAIKRNVEKRRLPSSKNIRTIESHIRVVGNGKYKRELIQLLEEVKEKNRKK